MIRLNMKMNHAKLISKSGLHEIKQKLSFPEYIYKSTNIGSVV